MRSAWRTGLPFFGHTRQTLSLTDPVVTTGYQSACVYQSPSSQSGMTQAGLAWLFIRCAYCFAVWCLSVCHEWFHFLSSKSLSTQWDGDWSIGTYFVYYFLHFVIASYIAVSSPFVVSLSSNPLSLELSTYWKSTDTIQYTIFYPHRITSLPCGPPCRLWCYFEWCCIHSYQSTSFSCFVFVLV